MRSYTSTPHLEVKGAPDFLGALQCVSCGEKRFNFLFQGPDRLQEKPGNFTLWRCSNCGTVALYPLPIAQDTLGLYPEDYVAYQPGLATGTLARLSAAYGASKQVRTVMHTIKKPGRALDIGCGAGGFLVALRKYGWEVHGIEINPRIARFAHTQRRLDVIVGDSLCSGYADNSFDLITFWDVLEHLPDPRRALQEAWRLARPSSLLVIGLPNPESLEAHWFGSYWAGWDVPRHFWLFPKDALVRLVEETGWSTHKVCYARGRHFLLAQSLRFWLQDRRISQTVYHWMLTAINSWAARALLLPYFNLVEWMKKGSTIVLLAWRKEITHA